MAFRHKKKSFVAEDSPNLYKYMAETQKEVSFIPTSSITKNFVISGKKQVEMFADAIEASANDRPVRVSVTAKEIRGEEELRAFMKMRKNANSDQVCRPNP